MKKGIVVLLLLLVVVVIASPGIVGRLAEKSVDENLNWAALESREVVVTSQRFDRGWFSSQGQHRVELLEGPTRDTVMQWWGLEDPSSLPVLIIDTRIDHGIIPVTSMTREKGSLAPGLGSAVSTLRIEHPGREDFEIPGKIFSSVGLAGTLTSNYVAESGVISEEGLRVAWGAVDMTVSATASSSAIEFDGTVEALDVSSPNGLVEVHDLSFSGDQRPSGYGYFLGDVTYALKSIVVGEGMQPPVGLGPMSVDATASIEDDALVGSASLAIGGLPVPNIGDMGMNIEMSMAGVDPQAMGALLDAVRSMEAGDPGANPLPAIESDLKAVLARGLEFNFDKLDVEMPQGTLETTLKLKVTESDSADFEWTSLLLAAEGEATIRVPEAVMDFIIEMNPQAGAVVGMGYLKKNGAFYEMEAAYKKGLLTINGLPMPIPLGG